MSGAAGGSAAQRGAASGSAAQREATSGSSAQREVVPPHVWRAAVADHDLPEFDPTGYRRVVVVAAHPDDETLGAGPVMRFLRAAGAGITIVVATDGEAAHPGLDAAARAELAAVRRRELAAALAVQGLDGVELVWLGLPDSALETHESALVTALMPLLAGADLCLAPWSADPHPDHRATGRAVRGAAPVAAQCFGYPVWMWAWTAPDDAAVPWPRACAVPVSDDERALRRAAVARFASQVRPGPDGATPVLAEGQLQHLDRDADLLFREPRAASAPLDRFRDLYAGGRDPWATGSWYERRKRAVVLATLPRERYRAALEPGCGAGELTVELSGRCARVHASDPVPDAVRRARARTASLGNVVVDERALPDAAGASGPVDLAVFSEVLYYLDDAAVAATLDRTAAVLEPGGDLVVVHWRGWPPEAPRDAAATHALVAAHPAWTAVVEHVDERFLLLVARRG